MQEENLRFYQRRLEQERTREAKSATSEARAAHLALAELYRDRIRQLAAVPVSQVS